MPLELIATSELDAADAAWQARIDLAAAHRLAVMHGLHEGIFNHLTPRVPGTSDRYYQIPFGLHWSEVTASCFTEVDYDGVRRAGEGEIEQSCYCIHAPMHRDLPQAAAVFHTHMPHASALARLEDPRILPIGQTELGTMMDMAYDDTYAGPAVDPAEGARLARMTGDKTVLMMANHGVATLGRSIAEAYDRLYPRAFGAGAALCNVDRAAASLRAAGGGRCDAAGIRQTARLWWAPRLRMAFRGVEATAGSSRARLQGLRCRYTSPASRERSRREATRVRGETHGRFVRYAPHPRC